MRVARAVLRLSAPALVTLGLLAAPAAHAAVPGLVGAYGFEESSGTAASDSSGAGNAGTIAGATRSATGKFGAALSFDGIDDRVNVADSNSLDLSPAMTLSAWVRPTATGWRTVLLKERPGGLAYGLYSSTDNNRPSAEVATSGTSETRSTATLASNAWSHLATTYDGTTLRLYVNGTQVATRAVSGSIAVSSGALRIGGNAIWGEYFRGLIDEVRVYNRALSVTELQGDMSMPVVSTDTTAPSKPGSLAATADGDDVTLSWAASADNVGVIGYQVYRGATLVTTTPGLSFVDVDRPVGTYGYTVVAIDAAGNASAASDAASATVPEPAPDTTPPSVTITRGCTTLTIHDYMDVWATVTDDRPGVVSELQIDGVRSGSVVPGGVHREWESRTVANGSHVLSVVARDTSGNQTTQSCDITVHNPVVTADFAAPTDGATVSGIVTIQLDPRADGEPLNGFPMTGMGVAISGGGVANGASSSKIRTWDTTKVANGVYTIKLDIGWMDYSNPRATKTISVTVDNSLAAPTGVTAEPYTTGVRLSWNAVAGAARYRAYRGTTPDFTPAAGNLAFETVNTSSSDLRLAAGTYHYKLVAVDAAGGESAPALVSIDLTADTTPPAVTLSASCSGNVLSEYVGPINGTVSDDRGGDVRLEVKVDETRIYGVVNLTGGYQFNWDTRKFADGPHVMRVIATDQSGNEKLLECPWTVDNRELTVPIVVPASPVSGTISVGYQPKADGANVSAPVQLRIDGVLVADGFGPYAHNWDTTKVANGSHTIEAVMYWPPYPSPQATSTVTVTVENAAPPAPSGLVAAYGFEETTGTTVTDRSPNGSTGTISGATRSTSGKFGRALSFDGLNDLVSVPDANSFDVTVGMTLSAWVRPTALGGDWRTVLLKSRPGGLAYALYAHTDTNRPAGVIQTASEIDARGTAALGLDTWTHLAATYDGTNVKLYINGTHAATRAATGGITVSSGALQIGGNTVWSEWFKGLIDEVRVYNRALSASEIAADRDTAVSSA